MSLSVGVIASSIPNPLLHLRTVILAGACVDCRREMAVLASRDIAPGEVVISAPPSVLITSAGEAAVIPAFSPDKVTTFTDIMALLTSWHL